MDLPTEITQDLAIARQAVPRWAAPRLQHRLKLFLDEALASVLLVLTSPILLLAMAAVRLTSRGPAIYRQPRIGYRCEPFPMYKLRTMRLGAEREEARILEENPGLLFVKLQEDPRVTRVGRFLRRTSLDELPQLVNVLRGEMSLVGPRPILLNDFRRFPRGEQLRRFAVLPGLTGLWQVSGRSLTTEEERLRLDLEYVERWSLARDVKILLRTLPAVLGGRGAT